MNKLLTKTFLYVFLIFFILTGCANANDDSTNKAELSKAEEADAEIEENTTNTEEENVVSKEESTAVEAKIEEVESEEAEETLDEFGVAEEDVNTVEPYNLHYIDAWGEWHDTMIDPSLKMHAYNWNLLINDGQNITYEDADYYIRRGIDVSHHQGKIDFTKVKEDGYEFVILRIGYRGYGKGGSLNKDKRFEEYIADAKNAGLDVGVYIFSQAINEEEALAEADFVLSILDGRSLELPIVYDPESIRDDVARTDDISGEQFTKNTIIFCEKIKEAGYEPMIYSNMIWESDFFDMSMLQDYKFWYADYELIPQTPYMFEFWQYSSEGRVSGIAGNVDLDIQFIKK